MPKYHRNFFAASPWSATVIALLTAGIALAVWLALPPEGVMHLMSEEGPIETSTSALYFLVALLPLALFFAPPAGTDRRSWLAIAVMSAAGGAREMDLHKAWTEKSVLKVSFYLGQAPLHQKLISLLVLAAIGGALSYLLRRHMRRLWQELRQGQAVAVSVATLFVTTVITKVLDRAINLLAEDYGVATSYPIKALVSALEETMELGLPLIVALSLWQFLRGQRR
jgi:hypothetical protein